MTDNPALAKARAYLGLKEFPGAQGDQSAPHGGFDSTFYVPAQDANAIVDGTDVDVSPFRGLRDGHSLSVDFDDSAGPLVALLHFACRPYAVLLAVGAGVLQSIKRAARWSRSHVAVECFEARSPLVAYDDSSSTVVLEVFSARVVATASHVYPDLVFGRVGHAVRRLGGSLRRLHRSLADATTIRRSAGPKVTPNDGSFNAANTAAAPFAPRRLDHRPRAVGGANLFMFFHDDETTWKLSDLQEAFA